MAVDDYRQSFTDNSAQQKKAQQRQFGFQQGLGTQAPTGAFPPPQAPRQQQPNSPLSGAKRDYGIPQQTNYKAPAQQQQPANGGGSFSQAWRTMRGNSGSQSVTAPSSSRNMKRSDSSVNQSSVNINFGDDSFGNMSNTGSVSGGNSSQVRVSGSGTNAISQGAPSGRGKAAPPNSGSTNVNSGNTYNVQKGQGNTLTSSGNTNTTSGDTNTTNNTTNTTNNPSAPQQFAPPTPGSAPNAVPPAPAGNTPATKAPAKKAAAPAKKAAGQRSSGKAAPAAGPAASTSAPAAKAAGPRAKAQPKAQESETAKNTNRDLATEASAPTPAGTDPSKESETSKNTKRDLAEEASGRKPAAKKEPAAKAPATKKEPKGKKDPKA